MERLASRTTGPTPFFSATIALFGDLEKWLRWRRFGHSFPALLPAWRGEDESEMPQRGRMSNRTADCPPRAPKSDGIPDEFSWQFICTNPVLRQLPWSTAIDPSSILTAVRGMRQMSSVEWPFIRMHVCPATLYLGAFAKRGSRGSFTGAGCRVGWRSLGRPCRRIASPRAAEEAMGLFSRQYACLPPRRGARALSPGTSSGRIRR